MAIPKICQEKLDAAEVTVNSFDLNEASDIDVAFRLLEDKNKGLARAVIFEGSEKPVIAVLAYSSMLDIRQFEQETGHSIKRLSNEASDKLFSQFQKGHYPLIPEIVDAEFFVDESLLKLKELYMQSGNAKVLIRLDQENAAKLYENSAKACFSISAEQLYSGRIAGQNKTDLDVSFTPIRLKQRVDETFDLPAMPEIAQDIMKLRVDPSADAAKLAAIVSRDPSLAAQVISWASSPYYGYQGKVDSVETAIARVLGFELVMNLALGISIGKSLKVPLDGPVGIRQFWKQAIYSANLAEKLCRSMPIKQRPERGLIYLSGLLHNFGHLLLGHIFPPQFELVNKTIEVNPHISIEDIEFYVLGVTHEEIGAWLMHNWHMPDELIVAVRRHHQEEFWSKHSVYSNIVLVANRLLKRLGIGDAVDTEVPASTLELLSLDESMVEETLKDIESEAETLDMMAKQLVA